MVGFPVVLFISGAPGSLEIIIVFVVILVLFGPQRLPAIARSIGRILNQLRSASQDFKDQVMRIEDEAKSDLVENFENIEDVSLSEVFDHDDTDEGYPTAAEGSPAGEDGQEAHPDKDAPAEKPEAT